LPTNLNPWTKPLARPGSRSYRFRVDCALSSRPELYGRTGKSLFPLNEEPPRPANCRVLPSHASCWAASAKVTMARLRPGAAARRSRARRAPWRSGPRAAHSRDRLQIVRTTSISLLARFERGVSRNRGSRALIWDVWRVNGDAKYLEEGTAGSQTNERIAPQRIPSTGEPGSVPDDGLVAVEASPMPGE